MYKRKYKKGKQITSLNELMEQKFIYHDNQVLHWGWFGSWQIRFAHIQMTSGRLYRAEKVDDEA